MPDKDFGPNPLNDAHEEIGRLRELVRKANEDTARLRRTIHGDEEEGTPGLRGTFQSFKEDMEIRLTSLSGRLDQAQLERDRLNWRLSMVSGTLKWLGPSGVMILIGFIVYIVRQGGV